MDNQPEARPKAKRLADYIAGDTTQDINAEIAQELRRLHAENERLRAAASFAVHKLESTRVWNGSGWTYNDLRPFHYINALGYLSAALNGDPDPTSSGSAFDALLRHRASLKEQQ